jgi:hypothetical protein
MQPMMYDLYECVCVSDAVWRDNNSEILLLEKKNSETGSRQQRILAFILSVFN